MNQITDDRQQQCLENFLRKKKHGIPIISGANLRHI